MSEILTLQRNVQFIYEEQLARIELAALGCTDCDRDGDDAWKIRAHVNGNADAILARSAYVGSLGSESTVYSTLIRPGYQGGRFNRTRSVNQYLTHWIYPYRGKFHPQMIRALLNILGAKPGGLVVDPFVGSGTTALESALLGVNFAGVDMSPLCVLLTRVKTRSFEAVEEIREAVSQLLARANLHPDTFKMPRAADERVRDFLQIARMVTYSDQARRQRDASAWFRKNLQAMLESVEAHARAVQEFGLTPGRVDVSLGDARDLGAGGIRPASVDVVVTSPPYSIALDYVKNDAHALEALGTNVPRLRSTMTGVRGRDAAEKLALYNDDMRQVFREVARVLKPGGRAAFVIGDATVDGREYTTTTTMSEWAEDAGLRCERSIPKIVFGLYSVMVDEKILVFRRP